MNLPQDTKYEEAVNGLETHQERIRESHKWCANMRSSKSISTTCIGFPEHETSETKFFPVSVCCTSDYCFMTSEHSTFTHACNENDECFLLRAGEVVQAIPEGKATVEACTEAYEGDDAFFPFLPTEMRIEICNE